MRARHKLGRSEGGMSRLWHLLTELWEIGREGSWSGAVRFARYKQLQRSRVVDKRLAAGATGGLGILGAGNYAVSIHLACLRLLKAPLYAIASASGHSARAAARVYGIGRLYQGLEDMVSDENCTALLIATPHHLHPDHILAAMQADRYAYCEKPVAIDRKGIERLQREGLAHPAASKIMIGFNRRYAPAIQRLKQVSWLQRRTDALEINYRINFGPRVSNAMSDPEIGGGRIHGVACHYVDLISHIAGVPIVRVSAMAISHEGRPDENTFVANLELSDGSIASLSFTSEGRRGLDSKEEVVISSGGHVARIVDFATLRIDGSLHRFMRHRYGALEASRAFLVAWRGGRAAPVSLADGVAATRVTLAIQESIRVRGTPIDIARVNVAGV